jgi:hypothetical protein
MKPNSRYKEEKKMKNNFFILFALILGTMFATKAAYAREECSTDAMCNQGEYCEGAGHTGDICEDCERECGENVLCLFTCWLGNQLEDCDGLRIIGTCKRGAIIYEHANYIAPSQGLPPGRYDISSISIGNDTLSSLKVPTGWTVTLYRHHNFTGDEKVFTTDTPYVGDDFNDQTSSIVVDDFLSVIIYQHADYQGNYQKLTSGRFRLSSISIGNDTLSSLKVPTGWRVTLYRHDNFTGDEKVFTTDTPYVGDDFNDQTSSIGVDRVPGH